jgi:cyclopropane fatty-acyl-phospholipid synthase-like methyltransferase
MPEKFNISQQQYWNNQHVRRETEFKGMENEPNEFAKNCLKYIKPEGKILEIGIANGRDSRYFAKENKNDIIGVDISSEAIRQLIKASEADGTKDKIFPIVTDAGDLPGLLGDKEYYDAFYSRSALHLDEEKIIPFLGYVVSHLNKDGMVMIEGKPKEDFKVERSIEVGKNCYEDVDGHIRRVWSEEDIKALCDSFNLEIIEMGRTSEILCEKETKFIHFIAKKK